MDISKVLRNVRFPVKGNKVGLILETRMGTQFIFKVVDCSITGAFCILEGPEATKANEELADDTIIPASKMIIDHDEVFLGRLAIRRKHFKDQTIQIALSTIDTRVPVDGKLSGFLEKNPLSNKGSHEMELPSQAFNLASFINSDLVNGDILDRTKKFSLFFEDWKKTDRFAYFLARTGQTGPRIDLKKMRDDDRTDFLMFGSNDYLGLSRHPEVIEASINAIRKYGVGSTGTAPTSGTTDMHEELAAELAKLYGKDDAIIYSSGYNANVGIIAGLAREQDLLVADILSHASIQDGMGMSRATSRFYRHNDANHLEKILRENRDKYGGCLVLTEGVFSMDGTIGNLKAITEVAKRYNARVYVDQGHCIGVLGEKGLGASEYTKTTESLDLIMGLFSKALGTMGGFVVGSKETINWLRAYSRSYMFATSFPPCIAAATLASLRVMIKEKNIRDDLQRNIKHFVKSVNRKGVIVDPNHCTPIIPIHIGDENKMGQIMGSLIKDGVFALPVMYPVVAKNKCRFRFSLTAAHSISDIDYAISALEKAVNNAGLSLTEIAADKMAKLHKNSA